MTKDTNTASGAADLRTAAQAVVDRWDTPLWKDVPATAEYIGRLRAALAAGQATAAQAVVPAGWKLVPVDATDEMVRATDEVNFENGDTDGTIHNVWHVMIAAAPAQPAAQQGAAYAALPEPYCNAHDDADACYPDMFSEHQMRAFADATHTLRASHGQASSQPDPAYSAACHLATALFKKYFAHLPDFASGQAVWSLCGSTAGVISQIDNMVSGLVQPPTTAFSEDELE